MAVIALMSPVHGVERGAAELRIPRVFVHIEAGAEADQRRRREASHEDHDHQVQQDGKTVCHGSLRGGHCDLRFRSQATVDQCRVEQRRVNATALQ